MAIDHGPEQYILEGYVVRVVQSYILMIVSFAYGLMAELSKQLGRIQPSMIISES